MKRLSVIIIALQFGNHGKLPGGTIEWPKVQIREL